MCSGEGNHDIVCCHVGALERSTTKKTTIQYFTPQQYMVNAAERVIQTFKNHFIDGLWSVDKCFPLQLWCDLLAQAELSLNILRTVRTNPGLSSYAILKGEFNFNKTPLAPPGTKALVFNEPKTCTSWQTHAKDAWYIGPSMEHYRCYQFWTPETRGYSISQMARFFPIHCTVPGISNTSSIIPSDN